LSLDVSIGAVLSALFFAQILHVSILPYGLATLALTVWIIYTIDHLRDARSIGAKASTARHLFHQRYFKALFILLILAIVVDGLLILFIRRQVFVYGVALGGIVGCYLVIQRGLYYLKEHFVALLYTLGVLLPSIAITSIPISNLHKILFGLFFLAALLNLMIFSWFDREKDIKDHRQSFVTLFGSRFTKGWICFLFAVFLLLSLWLLVVSRTPALAAMFLLMGIVLLILFVRADVFKHNESFRLIGDAIFFLPGVYILVVAQ
jgi:4-hydroxybenzoate polyprenyltransferase